MADNQGFANMDDDQQREIAKQGGEKSGGQNLSTEARRKGAQNSRRGSTKS